MIRKLLVMAVAVMLCLAFMVSFASAAVQTYGLVTTGTVLAAVGSVALIVWLVHYARAADTDLKSMSNAGGVEFISEKRILVQAAGPFVDLPGSSGYVLMALEDRAGGDGALGVWPEPVVQG